MLRYVGRYNGHTLAADHTECAILNKLLSTTQHWIVSAIIQLNLGQSRIYVLLTEHV